MSRHEVDDVLRRAGVGLRDGHKLPPVTGWAHRYEIGGETGAEIAATFGVTPNAVLRALSVAGIERRPAVVRMIPLGDDDVLACYVDDRLSLQATARRLGVSVPRVRAAVGRLGVLRAGFDPSSVDRIRFAGRYAAGATLAELADEFDLSRHHAQVAIRSFGLPRRLPRTHTSLPIDDHQLAAFIVAGHSDAEIAARHDVAVWAVTRRRRRLGVRRPSPNRVRPPLSRAQLERLLASKTRADIATRYRVGIATVTRWCAHHGVEVVAHAPPAGGHVQFDRRELRRLYIADGWSVRQIGDHLGIDGNLVAFALHSYRIPVRRGGRGSPDDAVVLLDALYADPDVVAVLERHGVPLRRRGGRLAQRFPRPAPLDAGLVDELYRAVGLSSTHISLLTGHSPTTQIVDHVRSPYRLRPSNRAPTSGPVTP